jgi:hypothetical protein
LNSGMRTSNSRALSVKLSGFIQFSFRDEIG